MACPEFTQSFGFGSTQISSSQILIFGSKKNNTFILDVSDAGSSQTKKSANVEVLKKCELVSEG